MPSPFPGMDPYLEGYLWPDVQQALAYQFRRQLAPLVEADYAVRLAVYMLSDRVPAHELGIMYPDVEVVHAQTHRGVRESSATGATSQVSITPAALTVPLTFPVQVRIAEVEIRDVAKNILVTSIEILSPANKREPGITIYLAKQDELRLAGVHVLEIDLIRRGARPWPGIQPPETPYLAILTRAKHVQAEVWPIGVRNSLPVLPVPLRVPDSDVPLDLQEALNTIYDEARYELTINYQSPPPEPELFRADTQWVAEQIESWSKE